MTQKYYLSQDQKAVMILIPVLLSFITFTVVLNKVYSADLMESLILLIVTNVMAIAAIIWRIKTPIVEISSELLNVCIPPFIKIKSVKWNQITGIVFFEIYTFGTKVISVKIVYKTKESETNEITFNLNAVEKTDEIIRILKEKISKINHEDIKRSQFIQKPITKKEIKYKTWIVNDLYVKKDMKIIDWDKIKEMKYQSNVIAGYGNTVISYVDDKGNNQSLIVQPSASLKYQEFIKYFIQHAKKAYIDPGLLKVFEYSPKDAKADMISVVLFLLGIPLFIIAPFFMSYYSPTTTSSNIYPLIIIPFALFPMIMVIKLLTGRYSGKTKSSVKKILWSLITNIGIITSIIVFFAISPFSYYWMMGDVNTKRGKLDKAEFYYQKSLNRIPDNVDLLYDLGKFYRERKEWEKAFTYLEKSYTQEPSYWKAGSVILLPDTLMKLGKYEEALQWCDEILNNHPNEISIEKAINKKRNEIINLMKNS